MRKALKSFAQEISKIRSYMIVDSGTRAIEVSRIVGSVDKSDEFDARFQNIRNRGKRERHRMLSVRKIVTEFGAIHPIDVYLLQNDYYIVDGHRRVASVKAFGAEFIDAHVVEYVDNENNDAVQGATWQRRFEKETGLRNIRLHSAVGYRTLLRDANGFEGKNEPTARQWFSRRFLPFVGAISESSLPALLPDLRCEDIFVLIADFYHEFLGGFPVQTSPKTLISGFLFARKYPTKRMYRFLPFRLLLSFIKNWPNRGANLRADAG